MSDNWQHYQQTGFEPIDVEHARISAGLERLLQAVNAADAAAVIGVLEPLAVQIAVHFAHEERRMAEIGYPLALRHKEAHDGFLRDVSRYLMELKASGLTDAVRRWATGRALEWFRFHVAANDVGLGRFLLAREEARRVGAAASVIGA